MSANANHSPTPFTLAVVLASATLLFSGCALAPGHKMDASKIANDGSFESSQVELVPITPEVIANSHTSKKKVEVPHELTEYKPETYRIGATDVLFITVWDHPELTVPAGTLGDASGRTVRPDGMIFYPYVGNVKAAGKTLDELREEITAKLSRYVDKPQVDVSIIRFNSQQVLVSGAFIRTLPISLTSHPLRLLEAVGNAGVNITDADLSSLSLNRDGKSHKLDINSLTREPSDIHKIFLKDGDSIHLPYNDNSKVYIMGEVSKPQALVFKSGSMSLTDAIGTAGGLGQLSSKGQEVYVIRGVDNLSKEKAKIFQLDAKSPSAFILAGKFPLQPQDVVYVGASGITRWNRVISQLIPSLSVLGLTTSTLKNIDNLNQ